MNKLVKSKLNLQWTYNQTLWIVAGAISSGKNLKILKMQSQKMLSDVCQTLALFLSFKTLY